MIGAKDDHPVDMIDQSKYMVCCLGELLCLTPEGITLSEDATYGFKLILYDIEESLKIAIAKIQNN